MKVPDTTLVRRTIETNQPPSTYTPLTACPPYLECLRLVQFPSKYAPMTSRRDVNGRPRLPSIPSLLPVALRQRHTPCACPTIHTLQGPNPVSRQQLLNEIHSRTGARWLKNPRISWTFFSLPQEPLKHQSFRILHSGHVPEIFRQLPCAPSEKPSPFQILQVLFHRIRTCYRHQACNWPAPVGDNHLFTGLDASQVCAQRILKLSNAGCLHVFLLHPSG